MSGECSAPPISADQHAIITGLALAGASVYGADGSVNPKFRAVTTVRERAEWWDDQLGWLSTGVRESRPERGGEGTDRQPGYQITTVAHGDLARYAWTLDDGGVPPRDLPHPLSALAVRAWLSHGAGVSFRPAPRLAFGARVSDARRDRLAALLRSLPIDPALDPTVTDQVVSLSVDETRRLQEYAAPAAPGSEYKWATSLVEYRALREHPDTPAAYRAALARHALAVARERTDGTLDAGVFDGKVDAVDAATVADTLGGGDFADALSVAGIAAQTEPRWRQRPGPGERTATDPTYGEEAIHRALRDAAAKEGEPLSLAKYKSHRKAADADLPSIPTIQNRFGRWTAALRSAGIETATEEYSFDTTYQDVLDGLRVVREELGEWPTTQQYDDHHPTSAPSLATIYDRIDGFDSWADAISDAKERERERESGAE